MNIESPPKTFTVKNWILRLKCGTSADINIREDKGESYTVEPPWCVWRWPAQKRESRILETEIAAIDYQEVEMKELKLYKPKKTNAQGQNESQREHQVVPEQSYTPKIRRDEESAHPSLQTKV